jgi:hypothetical protein
MLNYILESLLGEQSSKPLNAKCTLINNVVEVPNRHTGRLRKIGKGVGVESKHMTARSLGAIK